MIKTAQQELCLHPDIEARKLELAKQLLCMLNTHVMSDEGVQRTSFKKISNN
jgi:hypothetical protein